MHKPFYMDKPGADSLVIFIHGFMGSPGQFSGLAQAVFDAGFSAAGLLLPGHGTTVRDFSASTARGWINHVSAMVEEYGRSFGGIYLVGHSMGGLLALNAAHMPGVRGLFLAACPFVLRGLDAHVLKVRGIQAFYPGAHPIKAAYLAANGVPLSPAMLWGSHGPAAQLKGLISAAGALLPHIGVPVTAVYSPADEVVSFKSMDILRAGLTNAPLRCVTLASALHAYYPPGDQAVMEAALLDLIGAPPRQG